MSESHYVPCSVVGSLGVSLHRHRIKHVYEYIPRIWKHTLPVRSNTPRPHVSCRKKITVLCSVRRCSFLCRVARLPVCSPRYPRRNLLWKRSRVLLAHTGGGFGRMAGCKEWARLVKPARSSVRQSSRQAARPPDGPHPRNRSADRPTDRLADRPFPAARVTAPDLSARPTLRDQHPTDRPSGPTAERPTLRPAAADYQRER